MPLSYWSYAFSTAVYLINRLPTPTLHLLSPYHKLFGHPPNYSKLRSFGCLCYPWLRPYTPHKLAPRSSPCVFIGYSLTQSAYLCLDTSTSRIFTSRHVKFVESVFPFASQGDASESPLSIPPSEWCLLSLSVLASPSSAADPASSTSIIPTTPQHIPPFSPPPVAPTHTSTASPTTHPTSSTATPPRLIVTRSHNNIHKPIHKLNLSAQLQHNLTTREPSTVTQALKDPKWRQALSTEYNALVQNGTWTLVPPDPNQNLVGSKWIFQTKYLPDGSVDKYKARLVAKGFHQRPGIDFHETYSPVVKPTTIRLVLSIAISHGWPIRQLDVNNAFLQGILSEDVFMAQPQGFIDPEYHDHVCKLSKAIYGLKQAPRAWYHELRQFLLQAGFVNSTADTSLFIFNAATTTIYFLIYVDDIIITGNHMQVVHQFIQHLSQRFSLKDLGSLSYFLGVEVVPQDNGLFLCQRKYILDLLSRFHMADAKPVATPLAISPTLTLHSGSALSSPTEYRTLVGSLQYLSLTRPDIAYTINKLSQFMHQPTTDHWQAAKRLLRYLCGTLDHGITLHRQTNPVLHAFSDADWAGDKDDYTSTSAYLIYLGQNLISWSSKKQRTVARSSTEAEYRSVAATAAELHWLCSLLTELGVTIPHPPVVYCDNVGATNLCANPIFHSRMKHVALDYHFIREQVQNGSLRVAHVSSADQLADVLTKPLSRQRFQLLQTKIGLTPRTSILRGHDSNIIVI